MTSNISSNTTGHAYRHRPMPTNTFSSSNNNMNSTLTGQSTNANMNNNSNSSFYGSTASTTPIVASPTWHYSSPSQLARKYANITPVWCHITKPRQLKKKFASTFHQAQSSVNFYNEERAPSERRGSFTQSQQQENQSQQQSQPVVHSTNSNSHHYYRQPYNNSHYEFATEPTTTTNPSSSSSRTKKKYAGGSMTTHISSASRLQPSPPPPLPPPPLGISSAMLDEKFSNPTERKARIDQLKDLVFNTRVKDSMIGRSDSKNRSTTNLHKANSFKRIDQITNPLDDYQSSPPIPPTTPVRRDSHYYHYHLPTNTITTALNETLNRPIIPPPSLPPAPPPPPSSSSTITTATSYPSYNYDYLRAKSKERIKPTYYESSYMTNSALGADISNSSSTTTTTTANPLNSYRTYDDHTYISSTRPILSTAEKNTSYTSLTSYPSYQTPSSSKRRIKKYLLTKSSTDSSLSHQTEPILSNFENLSLEDDNKTTTKENDSSIIITNNHAVSSPSPLPTNSSNLQTTTTTTVIPSHDPTPPIPILSSSPPPLSEPISTENLPTIESIAFSTPNGQLSPSPPTTNIDSKIPPVIVVPPPPLSSSLTSLNIQSQTLKSTTNSLLDLVPLHREKEQSPSRSLVLSIDDEGCANLIFVCILSAFDINTQNDCCAQHGNVFFFFLFPRMFIIKIFCMCVCLQFIDTTTSK